MAPGEPVRKRAQCTGRAEGGSHRWEGVTGDAPGTEAAGARGKRHQRIRTVREAHTHGSGQEGRCLRRVRFRQAGRGHGGECDVCGMREASGKVWLPFHFR